MSAIAESLTKEISPAIQTLKTAREMWSKLAGMFDRDSTMRAVTLLGQLFSISFEVGSSMHSFLMKAKVLHDQLSAMNSPLTSTQLAALVLTKLPEEYEMVSRALRLQVTKEQLEFDDLSSFLIEEEAVLISQGKIQVQKSADSALTVTESNKKSRSHCYKCSKRGHLARDCKSKAKPQGADDRGKGKADKDDSDSDSTRDGKDTTGVAALAPLPIL